MKQNWLSIVILVVVVIAAYFVVQSVQQGTQQALQPFQQANNALQTQVSDLLHPTPTIIPDPVTIIHEVRALARLETIQYSVEKVITSEVNQGIFGPLFGDKLLFVAHGIVIAGVDLEKLNPEDLWLENGALYVRLPQAEIFVATLDNEKSYVYDRRTGLLSGRNIDLETASRQAAEEKIREAATGDGILDLAQQNAETYLGKFFEALGYQEVIFVAPAE